MCVSDVVGGAQNAKNQKSKPEIFSKLRRLPSAGANSGHLSQISSKLLIAIWMKACVQILDSIAGLMSKFNHLWQASICTAYYHKARRFVKYMASLSYLNLNCPRESSIWRTCPISYPGSPVVAGRAVRHCLGPTFASLWPSLVHRQKEANILSVSDASAVELGRGCGFELLLAASWTPAPPPPPAPNTRSVQTH